MPIFIDPEDLIEIKVRILNNLHNISIIDEDDEQENSYLIICMASGRDFETMSRILEDATVINHVNGERLLRMRILLKQIILCFFKSWNLVDEDKRIIPINEDTVGSMDYKLVKTLAMKWIKITR